MATVETKKVLLSKGATCENPAFVDSVKSHEKGGVMRSLASIDTDHP